MSGGCHAPLPDWKHCATGGSCYCEFMLARRLEAMLEGSRRASEARRPSGPPTTTYRPLFAATGLFLAQPAALAQPATLPPERYDLLHDGYYPEGDE